MLLTASIGAAAPAAAAGVRAVDVAGPFTQFPPVAAGTRTCPIRQNQQLQARPEFLAQMRQFCHPAAGDPKYPPSRGASGIASSAARRAFYEASLAQARLRPAPASVAGAPCRCSPREMPPEGR